MEIDVFHCKVCNDYFIFENTLSTLITRYDIESYIVNFVYSGISYSFGFEEHDFKSETILYKFGYNVEAKEDIPQYIRQAILEFIINTGIWTKEQVFAHLQFLVKQRKNNSTMHNAVERWNKDLEFLKRQDAYFKDPDMAQYFHDCSFFIE